LGIAPLALLDECLHEKIRPAVEAETCWPAGLLKWLCRVCGGEFTTPGSVKLVCDRAV